MQYLEMLLINIKAVAILGVFAYLITKSDSLQRALLMIPNKKDKIFLIVFFGFLSILGSFLGDEIFNGVRIESSMIGPIVGGIIGGPIVGIPAGIIGGTYNYFMNSVMSLPLFYSDIVAGVIGAFVYLIYGKERMSFLLTLKASIVSQLFLLIMVLKLTEPHILADLIVKLLGPVVVLINSVWAGIFITIIKDIQYGHELTGASYAEKALEIAKQTLPILKSGLTKDTAKRITDIIYKYMNVNAVAITDLERILAFKGEGEDHHHAGQPIITSLTKKAVELKGYMDSKVLIVNSKEEINCPNPQCPFDAVIIVPLLSHNNPIGYIKVYRAKASINPSDIKVITGIANLLSLQIQNAKLEEQAILLANAEYSALRAQVNPHFLFNTLSVIKWLVSSNPEYAKEIIVQLASFYRKVLKRSEDMVPFSEELYIAEVYVNLQKARYTELLEVNWDVDESCKEVLFPSFMLEPIVENAIKYGFSSKMNKFVIHIKVKLVSNIMEIIVTDSGVGFNQEVIDAVKNDLTNKQMGIGLTNINRRLKSLYEDRYTLLLENVAEGGKVTIRIPVPAT